MGLYGRSFTLKDPYDNGLMAHVRGKGEPGKYSREGGFLAYYEVCCCDLEAKYTSRMLLWIRLCTIYWRVPDIDIFFLC